MSCVSLVTRLDIINSDVDTNRIKLYHRRNREGGGWHCWKAPHQKLNAKSQGLQMIEIAYAINKGEVIEASVND
jgi:hypothetical protein